MENLISIGINSVFTGNILLKTAEGVVRFIANELRSALKSNPLNMLGAALATGGLNSLKLKLDPGAVNGAPLLGLNGIVIKSHGSADPKSYAAAVVVAANLARSDFAAEIDRSVRQLSAALLAKPSVEPEVQ